MKSKDFCLEKEAFFIDPRTKIFLLLVISTVMINTVSLGIYGILRPLTAMIPFLLLLTARRYRPAFSYFVFYWVSKLILDHLLIYTSGAFSMVVGYISSMGVRFVPGGMMGYYFFATTRVNEFVAAMERMHISQKIIIPIAVMFRFFPTVAEESRGISDAMRMRDLGWKRLFLKFQEVLEYRMVPLMTSTVNIGNELSASAMTRCLGMEKKRSNISRCGFGAADLLLFLIGTGLIIAGFWKGAGIL